MSDDELKQRYDRLVKILSLFNESNAETADLQSQIWVISTEISRRLGLAEGRTFDQAAIDAMKGYLVDNAKTERDSCIVCMNKGMEKLLTDPNQKFTPKSVEATMDLLVQSGHATTAKEIWFKDRRGRVTRGAARPHELVESVGAAVLDTVGMDVGWSVFGMSLLDGYHSVTLTVDTNNPLLPKIYWSDQWQSKKGWKEYSKTDLDKEIVKLIQGWWDDQEVGKKHNTVVRLWRLRQ